MSQHVGDEHVPVRTGGRGSSQHPCPVGQGGQSAAGAEHGQAVHGGCPGRWGAGQDQDHAGRR